MKLIKVISGGQTGADRAGLAAAKACGLQTGGWMPNGFKALDGSRAEFAELYGILETPSSAYPPRTALNVRNSDATIRFAKNFQTRGELLTLKLINQYRKPHLDVDVSKPIAAEVVRRWLEDRNVRVLNVAGNAEEHCRGIEDFVFEYLKEVFEEVNDGQDA
jgi:hypothetical protein